MEEDVVQLINKAKMMDLIDEDSTIYNLEREHYPFLHDNL